MLPAGSNHSPRSVATAALFGDDGGQANDEFGAEGVLVHSGASPETGAPARGAIHPPRRLALLFLAGGTLVVLAVMAYAPSAQWLTRSRGEHLTRAEVEGRVQLDIPEGASDVRFYHHRRPETVVAADFAITESDFLAWAARQGWTPGPIVGSITIWPRSGFGDRATVVEVTDGLSYHTLRRGVPNTFSVTYDRRTQRAYYGFSSEPHGED
jgi:hypothetical protein